MRTYITSKEISELNHLKILLIYLNLIIRPIIEGNSLPCPHLAGFSFESVLTFQKQHRLA